MEGGGDADRVADSLARWIASVSFEDREADQVTEFLVEAVIWWAQEHGWRAYRHARSVVPLPPPMSHLHSFVDVGIARPVGGPIVVEIDRSDRRRTLEKLVQEAAHGRVALWLRWGTGAFATPPDPVKLIPCRVEARKTTDRRRVFSAPAVAKPAVAKPAVAKPAPRHTGVDLSQARQTDLFGS